MLGTAGPIASLFGLRGFAGLTVRSKSILVSQRKTQKLQVEITSELGKLDSDLPTKIINSTPIVSRLTKDP